MEARNFAGTSTPSTHGRNGSLNSATGGTPARPYVYRDNQPDTPPHVAAAWPDNPAAAPCMVPRQFNQPDGKTRAQQLLFRALTNGESNLAKKTADRLAAVKAGCGECALETCLVKKTLNRLDPDQ